MTRIKPQPTPEITPDQLAELRQPHVGRLLIKAHRTLYALTAAKLKALGYDAEFSNVHGALLSNLDLEGTRMTVLAERLSVTKQSVSQLVSELEASGYVERLPDPTDRRAALVRFTPIGWRFCQDTNAVRLEVEDEFRTILGADGLDALRDALERLVKSVGTDASV
jgi:DNA-binding MarR family transcriptional regulator